MSPLYNFRHAPSFSKDEWLDKLGVWFTPEPNTGCWLWLRACTARGYGTVGVGKKHTGLAHRVSYQIMRGPIPEGMTLDHLCRTPGCVNPDHLEIVTQRENVLRGKSPCASHARKTHCSHGHEFTQDNTLRNSDGSRRCRACRDAHNQARKRETA